MQRREHTKGTSAAGLRRQTNGRNTAGNSLAAVATARPALDQSGRDVVNAHSASTRNSAAMLSLCPSPANSSTTSGQ
ncbi:MAG: hypothetical protein ACYS5W_08320 [Planctomycetota bacterium]